MTGKRAGEPQIIYFDKPMKAGAFEKISIKFQKAIDNSAGIWYHLQVVRNAEVLELADRQD